MRIESLLFLRGLLKTSPCWISNENWKAIPLFHFSFPAASWISNENWKYPALLCPFCTTPLSWISNENWKNYWTNRFHCYLQLNLKWELKVYFSQNWCYLNINCWISNENWRKEMLKWDISLLSLAVESQMRIERVYVTFSWLIPFTSPLNLKWELKGSGQPVHLSSLLSLNLKWELKVSPHVPFIL